MDDGVWGCVRFLVVEVVCMFFEFWVFLSWVSRSSARFFNFSNRRAAGLRGRSG